jgi:O-antigen/teichoic acid export membrane protein
MTQGEMGIYRLTLTGVSLSTALALPGVFEVLIRHIPRGSFGFYTYLFNLRLKVATLSVVGFAIFCHLTFDDLTISEALSLGLIALTLPLYASCQMYEAGYQAQMKFRELSIIYIGRTTVQLVGYLGAFLVLDSVFQALAFMIASMTAYHFWNHLRLNKDFAVKTHVAEVPRAAVRREAIFISGFAILPALMDNIDKIIVERAGDLESLAIYSVGMALGLSINAFLKPFLNSINAKLVYYNPGWHHYAAIGLVGTLIGGSISAILPYIVPLMYGEVYTPSVTITAVVTMSMGLFFCNTLYSNHATFNADKKLAVVYVSNIIVSVGTIVYMGAMTVTLSGQQTLLLALALSYPVKMGLSILSLWALGRRFR